MKEISNRVIAILVVVFIIITLLQFSLYNMKYNEITFQATAVGFVGMCIDNNPIIDDIPEQVTFANEVFAYNVNTNINDSNVTYYDDTDLFNINEPDGIISFTPLEDDVGIYFINITVFSNCNVYSDSEIMKLTIELENRNPILDPIPDFTINETELFIYDVNATDIDNDTIFYGENTNMFQINSETGIIYFTPKQIDVGNNTVLIWAMDEHGALDWESSNFEIIDVNNPPVFNTIGSQTAIIYENYTYDVNATDDDVKPEWNNLSYYDNSTFFNISQETGLINFYVNESLNGTYWVQISVTDGEYWDYETISFSIVYVNHAPNITSWYPVNDTLEIDEGESQYFNITKFDLDGTIPSTQWYVNDVAISGATYDEYTYFASYTSSGLKRIKAVISDGNLTDSHEWNVTVIDVPQGTFTAAAPSGGTSSQQCTEDWRCGEWATCPIYEVQTRECNDINNCGTDFYKPILMRSCTYVPEPTCEDGVVNCHDGECEIWIDCGGPCPPCPTCSDWIKNCHTTERGIEICEEDIDCGGPCPPCPEGKVVVPTVCGNGVCEDGELLLCLPDCGFFFGEFMLIIVILGAASVFMYKAGLMLLVLYRKKKPLPYTNMELLGAKTLRKLHLIELETGKKNTGKIVSELSHVMRDFFVKRFNIQKKFTYIELSEVTRRKKVGSLLADKISAFSIIMTELEYRHVEPPVSGVSTAIKNAITIVEKLTGKKMHDTLSDRAEKEIEKVKVKKEIKLVTKKTDHPIAKSKKYRLTEDDKKKMESISKLIERAEKSLVNNKMKETEETYAKIRDIYDNMHPEVKNKMYEETIRIIKLYNHIMKNLNND